MTDHHDHGHGTTSTVNHTINFAGLETIVAALTRIAITPVLSQLKTVTATLKRIEAHMADQNAIVNAKLDTLQQTLADERAEVLAAIAALKADAGASELNPDTLARFDAINEQAKGTITPDDTAATVVP